MRSLSSTECSVLLLYVELYLFLPQLSQLETQWYGIIERLTFFF